MISTLRTTIRTGASVDPNFIVGKAAILNCENHADSLIEINIEHLQRLYWMVRSSADGLDLHHDSKCQRNAATRKGKLVPMLWTFYWHSDLLGRKITLEKEEFTTNAVDENHFRLIADDWSVSFVLGSRNWSRNWNTESSSVGTNITDIDIRGYDNFLRDLSISLLVDHLEAYEAP